MYEGSEVVKETLQANLADDKPMTLGIKKLHTESIIPTRGSVGAVGYDLYSIKDKEIECHAEKGSMVKTGIAISLPPGVYGRIAPRSGLAVNHCIGVGQE